MEHFVAQRNHSSASKKSKIFFQKRIIKGRIVPYVYIYKAGDGCSFDDNKRAAVDTADDGAWYCGESNIARRDIFQAKKVWAQ